MALDKLLRSKRGKMLLVNAADMVELALLDGRIQRMAIRGLKLVLGRLSSRPTATALVKGVGAMLFQRASFFHLAARERPPASTYIAAVRSLEELKPILHVSKKVHRKDREIRNVLSPKPTAKAIARVGDIINRYPKLDKAILGYQFDLFWGTTNEEVQDVERKSGGGDSFAHALRDRLGLAHLIPKLGAPKRHLFVFEATRALADIQRDSDFIVARPTTIEGFDNPRFRQRRPFRLDEPWGFGLTVDLTSGIFADGAPEVVASPVRIGGNFVCRYAGCVSRLAKGTDDDFLKFLSRGKPYSDFQLVLDRA